MKTRFNTLDICAVLTEINSTLVGMRLANVYDINNKTYLLKLAKTDTKAMLLMESGIRLHISEFDWPKNMMPSGFSMKLRKHLKGRRLVYAKQLGIDRIVDMQFGSDDAAYHVILELYDRGNIILTDHTYTILNLLRYRKEVQSGENTKGGEDAEVRFAVNERYPIEAAKRKSSFEETQQKINEILIHSKKGDSLKRLLNPHIPFGAPCIEHCLLSAGFPMSASIGKGFELNEENIEKIFLALEIGEEILDSICKETSKGYIIQKQEKKSDGTSVLTNIEFHPLLFKQFDETSHSELISFNKAVDEFFGNLESQKADLKIVQLEKSAQKRLDNIKKDHDKRLASLETQQDSDIFKAKLIEDNLTLVEQAIRVVRTAIANQIDWGEINSLIKDAQANRDPVAIAISSLNLQSNEFTMVLTEVDEDSDSSSDEDTEKKSLKKSKKVKVIVDLALSAYGNAKKYYSRKKQASHKQQKIVESSEKAYKSAEKKMKQTFEEANKIHNIQKARKTFWFEKFIWFISSENYLVIGGRDAQQNEILVKKYLTENDVYVHADLHGATSCIIKNNNKTEIPPKTLNEAGTMAICHSAAWDAKVVTSAWWVYSHQVSKTAPSGEYLTTGSFLIRGKKNYLPPSNLIYGFGILFKVDETCIHKHQDERRIVSIDGSEIGDAESITTESLSSEVEMELQIGSDDSEQEEENDAKTANPLQLDGTVDDPDKFPLKLSLENANNLEVNTADQTADTIQEVPEEGSSKADPDTAVDSSNLGNFSKGQVGEDNAKEKPGPEEATSSENSDSADSSTAKDLDTTADNLQSTYHQDNTQESNLDQDDFDRKASYQENAANEDHALQETNHPNPESDGDVNFPEFPETNVKVSFKTLNTNTRKKSDCSKGDSKQQSTSLQDAKSSDLNKPSTFESNYAQPKRGQRHKLKKLKNKYKDQDEEERALKMELLQESQSQKARDRKAKKNKAAMKQASRKNPPHQQKRNPKQKHKQDQPDGGYDSEEERAKVLENEHLNKESSGILSSLTGCPFNDDILLFAIPVCAPYNTMHNYKFKVKLTPGNTKKGKGAKSALSLFQSMKEITMAEKDQLRSIKDHDLARNIPGKVKVSSTSQLLQRKKKHK